MTNPMLAELDAQAKWLRQAASEIAKEGHAGWGNTCTQAAECIERNHATLADMAKRLEAAERDAAVIKLAAEKQFLRDWLQFIDAPNPVCCGNPTVGAEYGGMQEMVCCGSPAAEYIDLSELVTAMNGRLAAIDATQEGEG